MIRVIPRESYLKRPWKNGGGTTFEIARHPAGSDGDFLWRISMAPLLTSGPFSFFPGMVRTLVLLEGEAVDLRLRDPSLKSFSEKRKRLEILTPYEFDGEWETEAVLVSPGLDFNVICKRGFVESRVWCETLGPSGDFYFHVREKTELIIFCLSPELTLQGALENQEITLKRYDSFVLSWQKQDEGSWWAKGKGQFLVVELKNIV